MEPVKAAAAKIWPGVPVAPVMLAGAHRRAPSSTRREFPPMALSGMFGDPDGGGDTWAERTHAGALAL